MHRALTLSEDEAFVLLISLVVGAASAFTLSSSRLHQLFTRRNPGIGLHRAAVVGTLGWAAYVMAFHGDESIQGIYVVFYLALGYAAVKLFGQILGPGILGLSVRRDVFVRGNLPIAVFTATLALTTGVLFGGSLWGEADPLSDDEGGWWIPVGFFLVGWSLLITVAALYAWRGGRFHAQLRREHDMRTARTGAVFLLSTGALILQGVAGDFWGWAEGLLSLGTIALMLIGHELLAGRGAAGEPAQRRGPVGPREFLEHCLFLGLAALCWWLNGMISRHFLPEGVGS